MANSAYYDDENDDVDDDDDFSDSESRDANARHAHAHDADASRDAVIMLIDASPAMFARDDAREGAQSAFEAAMRACFEFCRARVVVAPDDVVGVVAYNTSKSIGDASCAFERVCVVQRMDAPSASGALELSMFASEGGAEAFKARFGCLDLEDDGSTPATGVDLNQEDALTRGLWTASHMLESAPRRAGGKSVYLFTNESAPLRAGSRGDKLMSRAKEMAALGQRIEVLSLTTNGVFDSSVFYDAFTAEHCGARDGESALVVVEDGYELQREFLKKSRKRRRLKQTTLWLVPGAVGVSVGVYSLISEAKKSASILVDGKDLGEIRREQTYVCNDTGAQIDKPTKSFIEYDGKQLVFTNKELANLKSIKMERVKGKDAVGFHLMGFVDAETISRDLTLKKSHFIAAEETVSGSCATFQALLRVLVEQNKVAICAFARATRAAFRYVALIPQLAPRELRGDAASSEAAARLDPPEGFHVFYLPFRDDRRHPERVVAPRARPFPRADEEKIDAARRVVDAIRLTKWHPNQIPNPALQTHYRVLEMCALERNVMEPVHDDTEPNYEEWERVNVPALLTDYEQKCFAEARLFEELAGAGDDASGAPRLAGQKRKAIAAPYGKRVTMEASTIAPEYNYIIDKVKTDALSALTNDALKNYCAAHGLSLSGNKQQLVARVAAHVRKVAADALE